MNGSGLLQRGVTSSRLKALLYSARQIRVRLLLHCLQIDEDFPTCLLGGPDPVLLLPVLRPAFSCPEARRVWGDVFRKLKLRLSLVLIQQKPSRSGGSLANCCASRSAVSSGSPTPWRSPAFLVFFRLLPFILAEVNRLEPFLAPSSLGSPRAVIPLDASQAGQERNSAVV